MLNESYGRILLSNNMRVDPEKVWKDNIVNAVI